MSQTEGAGAPTLRLARRLTPTLPQLWALVPLAGVFVVLELSPIPPNDFWWHARAGQWIVENGQVPTVDLFSFTRAGEAWIYKSWLMEVVLYLLQRIGNAPLVVFFQAVAITTAYGLLLGVNRRAAGGDTRWAAIATLAAAAVGLSNWGVRPQTLSILLFSLTLYLLERHDWRFQRQLDAGRVQPRPDRALWWLVPIFVLWANGHGGFVFGLALLGTYLLAQFLAWLRRQRPFPRRETLVTLLSVAATLVTPWGPGIIDSVLAFARHPITQTLSLEFLPPTVRTLDGQLFFGFVVVLIVLLLASGYRPQPREALRLLAFGVLALVARRNEIWFGLVAAPTMAAALGHWATRRGGVGQSIRTGRPRVNLVIAAMLGLLVLFSLPWLQPYVPWPRGPHDYLFAGTPVRAVAFLRELPQPRRVFHSEAYGSYMIWASPEVPVFVDTRIELYPLEQWRDYVALVQARYDWEAILELYGVDTLLLNRTTQGVLLGAVAAAPGWVQVYQDEQDVIFQRRGDP